MISGVSAPHFPTSNLSVTRSATRSSGGVAAPAKAVTAEGEKSNLNGELNAEDKARVDRLKKIDQEVRTHEQAHKNAGGQYAGSASYGYQVGPDGRRYAVSGEVPIDIAPVKDDPNATVTKMNVVVSAALAPAKPSGQDRRVAAQAAALRAQAQAELAQKSRDELSGETDEEGGTPNSLNISASAAYEAGSVAESNEKISGNILDFFS